jgi:hypothetical protein
LRQKTMTAGLRAIATTIRCALPLVFVLVATPSFASSVCQTVRHGETATQLARRLTGDGRNKYQRWFQIVDRSSRSVPKSQYDRIRPGWQACVVKEERHEVAREEPQEQVESRILPASLRVAPQAPALQNESPPVVPVVLLRPIENIDLTLVWIGAAVILPFVGWRVVDGYVARRKAASIVMQHFAQRFVSEFERPLIQQSPERPVRARLRLSLTRSRLDILLAPGEGRRYPNLSDHKKNMEYDVVRVLRVLADNSFARDPLYSQAGWVVVPFRFKAGQSRQV